MTKNILSLSHLNCWTTLPSRVEFVSAKRDTTDHLKSTKKVRKSWGWLEWLYWMRAMNMTFISLIFSSSKNRNIERHILQDSPSNPEWISCQRISTTSQHPLFHISTSAFTITSIPLLTIPDLSSAFVRSVKSQQQALVYETPRQRTNRERPYY